MRTSLSNQRGLSLLEILVVLAILGLVVATTTPNMVRVIESVRFDRQADTIIRSLMSHRVTAFLNERPVEFLLDETARDARYLSEAAPEGWLVSGDPLTFTITGYCLGNEIRLQNPSGRTRTYILTSPDCSIEPSTA